MLCITLLHSLLLYTIMIIMFFWGFFCRRMKTHYLNRVWPRYSNTTEITCLIINTFTTVFCFFFCNFVALDRVRSYDSDQSMSATVRNIQENSIHVFTFSLQKLKKKNLTICKTIKKQRQFVFIRE